MLKTYFKPELYPLGSATFLTHGIVGEGGVREKDANGQESLFYIENGEGNGNNNGNDDDDDDDE